MKTLLLCLLLIFASCGGSKSAEKSTSEPPAQVNSAAPANEVDGPVAPPQTAPEDVLPNDGTRKVGDVTTCPVTGDVFRVTANSPQSSYDGGTYYLCCKGCVEKFAADPAKYVGGDGDASPHGEAKSHSHHHDSGHEH